MNKRCIGIDIGPEHLCAAQVSRTQDGFLVEKVFTAKIRRSMDSPPDILAALFTEQGFDRRAETAVSIPGEAVFFQNIESDPATIEQLSAAPDAGSQRQTLPNADQLVTETYIPARQTGPKTRALLAAVDRGRLRERLNVLIKANIHPTLVETALFAVNASVQINHPDAAAGAALIVHLDRMFLTITATQDGSVVFARKLPASGDEKSNDYAKNIAALVASEVRLTYQKLFGSEIPSDAKIYLVPQVGDPKTIETELTNALHCHITLVDPFATVKHSPECGADTVVTVAEGLALRTLSPQDTTGLNFLNAFKNEEKSRLDIRKELITIATLAAAVILVTTATIFARLWRLEREYAGIQNQTIELFSRTLPDEKNIVNPLVQLEQKIATLQTDDASFGSADAAANPLETIQQVTQTLPDDAGITVGSLLLSADSVRIAGAAGAFAPVYQWQQLLSQIPGFASVDVKDIQRLSAGQPVNFTILISLAKAQTQ